MQKPIVGYKRAVFRRYNAKFYCKTCKKLQNPPFFGFFGVESPHFDPEGGFKPDFPCRGRPCAKVQTAVAKWGYLYLSAGCKIRASHLWEISAQAVRGQGAATPQAVSMSMLAVLAMKKSKKKPNTQRGDALGRDFPPPGAGHPTSRKNQRKQQQRTEKERADHHQRTTKRERGVIAPFWDTFIHICKAGVLRSNSTKIQKLYLAENHIKRYNNSTRRLQPSGA